jgi:hypothetical protein
MLQHFLSKHTHSDSHYIISSLIYDKLIFNLVIVLTSLHYQNHCERHIL